jgi:DUF1009 family protein
MMSAMTANIEFSSSASPLGIIAGSGDLPRQLIDSCMRSGRSVFIIAIEGETETEITQNVPHVWIRLGAIGTAIDHLRRAGANELVLAGKINRPSLSALRPDAMGAKLISKLGFALFGGDAAIFKTIVTFLEGEGFRIIGIDEMMQDLIMPEGLLGQHMPDKNAQKDIELGAKLVRAIGAFDVGQAVIVKNGLVLGVEAAEGTDVLIERCGALQIEGKGGVLVKARKPSQEERVDLPTIGTRTIELVHQAGFAGIAVEANHSLIVGRREAIRRADMLGLFVIGFSLYE